VLVPFAGVLLWLGESDPVLIQPARLLGVEHSERPHHEEAVVLLFAGLIDSGPLDRLEEDDVRSLFAFEDVSAGVFDLIERAPPFRLEAASICRKLKEQLVDALVGIAR